MSDDQAIWDAFQAGGPKPRSTMPNKPRLATSNGNLAPLVLCSAKLPPPNEIPPRQWLYGTQLLRGFVTVLVAPGGTGKSTYAMVVAVALASGKKLLGEHIFAQVRTAILNLEDPMDELDRRMAAIMLRYRLEREELNDRIFLHSGEDRPVTMAAMGDDGFTVIHPDEDALTAEILAHDIGLLTVDPFAESHTLEENSNPQMIQAAAAWRRIARATNCAIMLVHHVRKGAVLDIDSARGAKGLTDSARVGLLLSSMAQEDADTLGIPMEERWQYVRLDDAKTNMAPKATKARWFKLEREDLHNATEDYPNGDKVATMVSWEQPSIWATTTSAELNSTLDLIAKGFEPGVLYSATKRGGGNRWAGKVICQTLGINDTQAANLISVWLKNGTLFEEEFMDPTQRKKVTGVRVNNVLRPS